MTYDTIRQKFIYNTPFDDNEFPLVIQDKFELDKNDFTIIPFTNLYRLEEEQFDYLISNLKLNGFSKIVIQNAYTLKSNNPILNNAVICYLKAFVYLFKKKGFQCLVSK